MRDDLAFVFPGQGSQKIGMLASAAEAFPDIVDSFSEASDALGFDLWGLVQNGDAEALQLTENTQPALLVASVALWRVWCTEGGVRPSAMSGHSLGEFSALCCAGVLSLPDAARLVRERGRFMQKAVPVGEGAMAAVLGLDDHQVVSICAEVAQQQKSVVEAVNFNAPGQVVIAGERETVDATITALKSAGAKRAILLPVSAPFHTSLMTPAGEQLSQVLETLTLNAPSIPVIHNVSADTEGDPKGIHKLLVQQISSPVRWTDCIAALQARGIRHFAECGAGKVLGGLLRRVDKSLVAHYLEDPAELIKARADLAL